MDTRGEIREFLLTRRAKLTPEQVGLPRGRARRVPGLRREEVAVLAGVSTDWYVRLEKGHISGVSQDVLSAVARALRLDEAEQVYLFDLARAARSSKGLRERAGGVQELPVRPSVLRLLESMQGSPAFVRNGRLDVLAINPLGRALYAPVFDDASTAQGNLARFAFLDPRATGFYPDWADLARSTVAVLHAAAGRSPHDRSLTDLVGELATRSDAFADLWAGHDVLLHRAGTKTFQHPLVGGLEVSFDSMDLTADPGLTLTAYSAEPGSPSEDALRLLASWTATSAPAPAPAGNSETTQVQPPAG